MSSNIVLGRATHTRAAARPNDLVGRSRKLMTGARVVLVRHGERMERDPAYRESFDHLIDEVAAKEGRLGKNARLIEAVQSFLGKAL